MNCQQARNLFDAYLDGELSGSLSTEFGAHRLNCPTCRREVALLEVAGHVVATDADTPLLSEEFTSRLLECAAQSQRPWYRRRRVLLTVGAPLVAAASLVFFVSLGHELSPTKESGAQPHSMVLQAGDEVDSLEELLSNIESARSQNPTNEKLREAAELVRRRIAALADGTTLLENYGKETMMEVLESIRIDAARENVPQSSRAEISEDRHDPPVEDL